MKKRILSVLISGSLLFGTVFANAVSIGFEDLERSDQTSDLEEDETISDETESNIFFEDLEQSDKTSDISSGTDFAYFNNTSVDTSKYIIYENTVHTNNGDYDLVIYPFKGTYRAELAITKIGKGNQKGHLYPFLHCGSGNTGGYSGYELFVCEHGNVNKKIDIEIMFGGSDLDTGEYYVLPQNFEALHIGSKLKTTLNNSNPPGIKYCGTADSDALKDQFDTSCVIGHLSGVNVSAVLDSVWKCV